MLIGGEIELLCHAIKEEAQREAEKILLEARTRSEAELKDIQERIQRELEEESQRQRAEAHFQAQKIIDAAELAARKTIVATRETIVREAMEELQRALKDIRHHPEYKSFMERALKEAMDALPGKNFIVRFNPEDQRFERRLKELAQKRGASIDLEKDPHISGGLQVYTADGRILYDNTVEARLQRLKETIQRQIWEGIRGGG